MSLAGRVLAAAEALDTDSVRQAERFGAAHLGGVEREQGASFQIAEEGRAGDEFGWMLVVLIADLAEHVELAGRVQIDEGRTVGVPSRAGRSSRGRRLP